MRTGILLSVALGAISLVFPMPGASGGGTLSGVVLDEHGVPVINASVAFGTVQKKVTLPNGKRVPAGPLFGGSVSTGADGRFVINDLPAATYQLCASGLKNSELGSCDWGQGPIRVELNAGQAADLTFRVTEGAVFTILVDDPKRLIRDLADLQTREPKLPLSGGNFAVGVFVGSRYVRARLVTTSGSARRYELVIPKTVTPRLFLDTELSTFDAAGVAISTGRLGPPLSTAGDAQVVVNLAVR